MRNIPGIPKIRSNQGAGQLSEPIPWMGLQRLVLGGDLFH